MGETRRNLMVGLFMVCGLGALGYLLVLFGEAPSWLGGAEWELRIRLDEISGIEEGTPIYLNGIKVGRVTKLDFVDMKKPDQGIEIVGQISDEFSVPTGAVAECVGPALGLGRGRIDLFARGEGEPIEPNGVVYGITINPLNAIFPESLVTSVETTLVNVGKFSKALTPVADDLHELLKINPIPEDGELAGTTGFVANLHTAVQRLDRTLASFDRVIGDPELRNGLTEAVENIRAMSADGKVAFTDVREMSANLKRDTVVLAEKAQATLDNFDQNVTRITDATVPVLDEGARAAANLRLLTDDIRNGKGTLGLLLTDERLYEVLVLSIERAREMIDSLRRLAERFEETGRIGLTVNGFPVEKKLAPR